jgi:ABC-type nitrate/sulfonate/bicarbonate transport system substrate-binding protein
MMRLLMRKGAIALFGAAMLAAAPSAFAADTVSVGSVDATSANLWPLQIARTNGYFDAAGINIDLVFAQSNASSSSPPAPTTLRPAPASSIRSAPSTRALR